MGETSESPERVKFSYKGAAEKIRHLYTNHPEMSRSEIARRAKCDSSNVTKVLKRFLGNRISDAEHRSFADNKAEVFERMQHRMLGSITDKSLQKASPLQLTTAVGILEDKLRTIRGQASSYNVTALLDLVEQAKMIRDARPALEAPTTVTDSK